MSTIIASGQTPPGTTNWQQYTGNISGIFVDVNTSAAGFSTTPVYVTSLGGNSGNWSTTGGSSVYQETPAGFRVYVRFPGSASITPAEANSWQWHINWIAIQQ
jgi:hypothetical protein